VHCCLRDVEFRKAPRLGALWHGRITRCITSAQRERVRKVLIHGASGGGRHRGRCNWRANIGLTVYAPPAPNRGWS